jgi:hypothetical protein
MSERISSSRTVIREAVGVFHDAARFQAAIDELLSSGFDRAELSLLAGEASVIEKLGHGYRRIAEFEDDIRVPRVAYISTESIGDAEGGVIGLLVYVGATVAAGAILASGGTLMGAMIAAAMMGGAGGAVGAGLARLIGNHHAAHLQRQIDAGGLMLWVHIRDAKHGSRAIDILARHGASDIHQHDLVHSQYLPARPEASDLERALLDPTSVFRTPEEVLARQDMTRDQKAAILLRWRYDAIELEVAETEGMRSGELDLLDRVLDALRHTRRTQSRASAGT